MHGITNEQSRNAPVRRDSGVAATTAGGSAILAARGASAPTHPPFRLPATGSVIPLTPTFQPLTRVDKFLNNLGLSLAAICAVKCLTLPVLVGIGAVSQSVFTFLHNPVVVGALFLSSAYLAGRCLILQGLRAKQPFTALGGAAGLSVMLAGLIGHFQSHQNHARFGNPNDPMCGPSPTPIASEGRGGQSKGVNLHIPLSPEGLTALGGVCLAACHFGNWRRNRGVGQKIA